MRSRRAVVALIFASLAAFAADDPWDPTLDLPVAKPEFEPPTARKEPGVTGRAPLAPLAPLAAPPLGPTRPRLPDPPQPAPASRPPPYATFFGEEIAADKFILVADVSGSMFPSRIKLLRAELAKLLAAMPERTIFNVVRFSNTDGKTYFQVLWPRAAGEEHEGMRLATPPNKAAAQAFVDEPTRGGDTPTFHGVKAALDFLRNDRVVLLTDGQPSSWVPWKELEFDPRGAPNMVPGRKGGPPENMAAGVDGASGWSLGGNVLQHEYLIWRENHLQRPAKSAKPARIDVFAILDPNEHPWVLSNMKWFCREVAARNDGMLVERMAPP